MKNKITRTLTAFAAALILMGGFSVPAFAQGAAAEQPAPDARASLFSAVSMSWRDAANP